MLWIFSAKQNAPLCFVKLAYVPWKPSLCTLCPINTVKSHLLQFILCTIHVSVLKCLWKDFYACWQTIWKSNFVLIFPNINSCRVIHAQLPWAKFSSFYWGILNEKKKKTQVLKFQEGLILSPLKQTASSNCETTHTLKWFMHNILMKMDGLEDI